MYPSKKLRLTYFFSGTIVFIYIIVRAVLLDVTYDEAWTIETFVTADWINIINYTPTAANNHMINSLLIKLIFLGGYKSVFIARLPNVFFSLIYIYYSYQLCIRNFNPLVSILLFLSLLLNPFLLDYFSLARGYGISLGLLIMTLHYLFEYTKHSSLKQLTFCFISGSIMTLSNFSFLSVFMAIIFIAFVQSVSKKQTREVLASSGIACFTLVIIMYEPIRKLIKHNCLWYGGQHNILEDTIMSVVRFSSGNFYNTKYTFIVTTFLVLLLVYLLFRYIKSSNRFSFSRVFNLLVLLLAPLTIATIQHLILKTPYPTDRTAVYLIPIYLILIAVLLNDSFNRSDIKFYSPLSITLVLALTVNIIVHSNFHKTIIWFHDAHTFSMLQEIESLGANNDKVLKVDSSWPFRSSINHYLKRFKFDHIEYQNQTTKSENSNTVDVYILLDYSLHNVGYLRQNEPTFGNNFSTICKHRDEHLYFIIRDNFYE